MKTTLLAVLSTVMAFGSLSAYAGNDKADIKVMTQNQYLGADLGPVISAGPADYPAAIVQALQEIAIANIPERSAALAESIADRRPHLVALQEVYAFSCIPAAYPAACFAFGGAFNDHLELTMDALEVSGSDYVVAAELLNLAIPGLPVYLPGIVDENGIPTPAIYVTVYDRDVILARGDVEASAAEIPCAIAAPAPPFNLSGEFESIAGCHYKNIATVQGLTVKRGYIGVNASVKNVDYLFLNTHLEVKKLGASDESTFLQPAQAYELNMALGEYLSMTPGAPRIILSGDFNSGPASRPLPPFGLPTAYQQLSFMLTDAWNLRPGKPDGFTCCQAADLLNDPSSHDERIDIVFAYPAPAKVKANVMDADSDDKTISGLWPSDHASVIVELIYD